MRFKFLDLLLFALLFIFVTSFPIDLITTNEYVRLGIRIALRSLLLAYDIYILWKNRINIFKFANYRNVGLFIPFILICFSNIFAALFAGSNFVLNVEPLRLVLVIIYYLLGVILEEFLFRLFIQSSLVYASSIKRIVVSAAIFALFHLLNIVNISQVDQLVAVLTQVVYAFGLGLLLGLIYEYTYSLPACIIFHFLFNFFNKIFVNEIYLTTVTPTYELSYYMTALGIGVIVGVYALLIYLFILRKLERYFRQ